MFAPFLAYSISVFALQASPAAIPPVSVSNYADFGRSVALSGSHLVVGAPGDGHSSGSRGSIQFYERIAATGAWIPGLRLEGQNQQHIGESVAIDGDVAVIGNRAYRAVPGRVIERSSAGWAQTGFVHYPGSNPNSAQFGLSVDVSDGLIVVGAPQATHGTHGRTGAVYVYEKMGGTWTLTQRLLPPVDPATGSPPQDTAFGQRLAIDGDTLAISAPNRGFASAAVSGRVTVWRRVSGSFTLEGEILAPALPHEFRFGGFGFALQGDTLAVGSHRASFQGFDQPGVLHIYGRSSGNWAEVQRLADPLPSQRGAFGSFVALDDDRLLVGRLAYLRRGLEHERLSLEAFARTPASGLWFHDTTIFDPHEGGVTDFGEAAALEGDILIAGVPRARVGMELTGMVYAANLSSGVASITSIACGGDPCSCPSLVPWLGCQNSARRYGALTAIGSASVSADDLTLSILGLPSLAVTRVALGPGFAPAHPSGDGALCIQSPRQLAPRMADANGWLAIPEGLLGRAAAQLGAAGQVLAGETWVFQGLYRHTTGLFPCATHQPSVPPFGVLNGRPYLVARGFSLTNGIRITFTP